MKPGKLGKGLVLAGAILLILTSAVHFFWGYPALRTAIERGAITSTPMMKTEELRAVWIALSSDLLLLASFLLVRLAQGRLDRQLAGILGLLPLAAGLIIAVVVPGFHPAVPLLCLPGACIVLGGWFLENDSEGSR